MYELVDIAAVPNQALKYHEGLKDFYKTRSENLIPELAPKKVETTSVPWAHASKIMWNAMQMQKRFQQ